jgi:sialic acid synthase
MRIIAEVGQNHQGSPALALDYINEFSKAGATSIKFQKRDLKSLFHPDALKRPYDNPNSFGITYGDHRSHLELGREHFSQLIEECRRVDVEFICTPFDLVSASFLHESGCRIFKISSFDLGNLSLLYKVSSLASEVIISTGGARLSHVQHSYNFLIENGFDEKCITILHCVSLYPTDSKQLDLNRITSLLNLFPNSIVGISDHFPGVVTGSLSYALGARCFEKHVTFNRAWKGTDHAFALEPEGFRKYARDIRLAQNALTNSSINSDAYGREPVFQKLGKSIVASRSLLKGHVVQLEDLSALITPYGEIDVREMHSLIGRIVRNDLDHGQPIKYSDLN